MRTWQLGPTLRSIHSSHSQEFRGRSLRSARFVGFEQRPPGLDAGHGGVVQPVELAPDGGVHRLQREEGLMAQHQQDARLSRPDAGLDQPLVRRPS